MTAHPFDLKTVVLAKHAQHVVLIHFPIALFITGVGLDFTAHWLKRPALNAAAYINLLLAAVATVPAVATGLVAWQWALEGQRLKGILLMHMLLGLCSTGLMWTAWCIHFLARRKVGSRELSGASLPDYRLVVELVGVAVVALTGHLGGFLSGVNS
ncbi:MAG: DUF2231 domain-containing protein [Acidobacteriota bacterium]|nr:DUF2231 domain-containing protein [Acidobacteriota bacterium]